jgi:Transposase DDE domain
MHEVTNVGSDRHQLKRMSEAAREALGTGELTALADRGYYGGEEIKACHDAGIVPLVPKVLTSNSKAEGRYDKSDFVYDRERDAFRCPAGEYAIRRFTSVEKGMAIHKYWSSACPRCALRVKCTTAAYRRIGRWEHEHVLDEMQSRLDACPKAMQVRRSTAEHPFGTIKAWMGATHFLCRRFTEGERRDESARAGLQPEASDENHGNGTADRGAARLIAARINQAVLSVHLDALRGCESSHSLGQKRTRCPLIARLTPHVVSLAFGVVADWQAI